MYGISIVTSYGRLFTDIYYDILAALREYNVIVFRKKHIKSQADAESFVNLLQQEVEKSGFEYETIEMRFIKEGISFVYFPKTFEPYYGEEKGT